MIGAVESSSSILPITAMVAIIIFVLKEALEQFRRFKSDRRKVESLKALLAVECQKNLFSLKRLKGQLSEIASGIESGAELSIVETSSGTKRLKIAYQNGGGASSPLPEIHRDVVDKFLYEAASIDKNLFKKMNDVFSESANFEHVVRGLRENVSEKKDFLDDWTGYAESEVADFETAISDLYKYCTGSELKVWRVR